MTLIVHSEISLLISHEKGVSDKKFKSNHQTLSAGGGGWLGMRLGFKRVSPDPILMRELGLGTTLKYPEEI